MPKTLMFSITCLFSFFLFAEDFAPESNAANAQTSFEESKSDAESSKQPLTTLEEEKESDQTASNATAETKPAGKDGEEGVESEESASAPEDKAATETAKSSETEAETEAETETKTEAETETETETKTEAETEAETETETKTEAETESKAETETEKNDGEKPFETETPLMKLQEGKPVKYFELYGYFNIADTFLYNMALSGNNPYFRRSLNDIVTDDATGGKTIKAANEKALNWAWLKLHLEPVINIAETMEIHTKLSIFGNSALGADNFEADKKSNGLLRDAQLSTSAHIVFEALWASIDTPIGELKVGRTPFHWGLGILYNDGNKFNSQSSGNYLDRIQLTIPISNFKLIPAFDVASSGLLDKYQDFFIDPSQKDDGFNVSLMFMMQEDDPAILKNKLLNEKTVMEFGLMAMFSWKNNASGEWKDSAFEPTDDKFVDYDKLYAFTGQSAKLWKLDGWFNLHYKNFSLKLELAFLTGTIGKMLLDDGKEKEVKSEMVGVAVDMEYRIIPKFHLSFLTGAASPDDAENVQADSWNIPGNSVVGSSANNDRTVKNFRFNKDYDFNSALWNQILGRFTAGYYASLLGKYFIIDDLKLYLGLTYSMALQEKNSLGGRGLADALEPFVGIDYSNKSGFRLGTRYQFGVPFNGLDSKEAETSFFHYLNVYLGIVF